MSEKFDTSGAVAATDDGLYYFAELDPFVQGYVEAMLQEFNRKCFGDFPIPRKSHLVGFSDLAPETLVRIMEDCAKAEPMYGIHTDWGPGVHTDAGRRFWVNRQASDSTFPPLTLYLNDAGKVAIRP